MDNLDANFRNPDDLDLSGQALLDALTHAHRHGDWRGWTFGEISRSASVLPMTVHNENGRIVRHVNCVILGKGSLSLLETTENGFEFHDYERVKK